MDAKDFSKEHSQNEKRNDKEFLGSKKVLHDIVGAKCDIEGYITISHGNVVPLLNYL